jgi:SAM-dependent methyltransferase
MSDSLPQRFNSLVKAIASATHPYFLARYSLRALISRYAPSLTGSLLDVGCGSRPYRDLFRNCHTYHGLELSQRSNEFKDHATYFYDGSHFPFADHTYSVVLCSQVLEHSKSPDLTVSEMYRVLRTGGLLLLSMPFMWPEHEQPFDYQRFTSYGLKDHLSVAGFEILHFHKTCPGAACLLQLLIEFNESSVRRFTPDRVHAFIRQFFRPFYFLLNGLGLAMIKFAERYCFNSMDEFYLDLFLVAVKR